MTYLVGMKKLTIPDAETVVLALQDEIRRSPEARYDHRLHGILLVAQGISCNHVAHLLGDAPRTVAYWVRRFDQMGLAGLADGERPGRPGRLSEKQIAQVGVALRRTPRDYGLTGYLWDGKTLAAFLHRQWGIDLSVRQCQRLFRRLRFRLRKPRSEIARADPDQQARFKKNSENS